MEPYADVSCILRVDTNCDACKFKMIEVISSVAGNALFVSKRAVGDQDSSRGKVESGNLNEDQKLVRIRTT
nr:heavy metal-associated isoprenylated plant protein 32-like [Ipomoea batatas]